MKKNWIGVTLTLILFGTGFSFKHWQNGLSLGNKLLNEGQIDQALDIYNQVLIEAPDEPLIHYNQGNALYQKEDFMKAKKHFSKTLELAEDNELRDQAEYNLGNTNYREGEALLEKNPTDAMNKFEKSLQHYQNVIKKNTDELDAKYNYEFVKKKLDELKEQMENQEQENSEQDQQGDQQQNQDQESEDQKEQDGQQNAQNQEDKEEEAQNQPEQQQGETDQSEQVQGLTEEEAMQLLEQFEDQVGEFIPMQQENNHRQNSYKDW
ncbi:MAG: tetratricopeptide repeat protein [Halanaerobiales bacterium]|nr:tetratricopeptide repeat protein [Halanaerobiales bacterium]